MLFTGDKITTTDSEEMGLIYKAVPQEYLNIKVEKIAERICAVPINQLMMQKLMINQAKKNISINHTQMLATIIYSIARHTPEGINFKERTQKEGLGKAVTERDQRTYDWTKNKLTNKIN